MMLDFKKRAHIKDSLELGALDARRFLYGPQEFEVRA